MEKPEDIGTENRIAQCIRNVTNISNINGNMLLDKGGFNIGYFKKLLDARAAPKITKLLDTISKLDKKDIQDSKRLYKHIIFTDCQSSNYGAKLIASALVFADFTPAFTNNLTLKSDDNLEETKNNNFAILMSQKFGNKTPSVKFKTDQIAKYNERPGNVHGKKIRFIILDQGFKEGIDLFDVKYVHLFEPLVSRADEKQAIGRGTRFCGQKGLEFHPKFGWPLYVFRYDLKPIGDIAEECKSLFELFVKFSSINMKRVVFSAELEKVVIDSAIDKELNSKIHFFGVKEPPPIFFGGGAPRKSSNAPQKIMNLSAMRLHIAKHFKKFKYPKVVMKNNCLDDGKDGKDGKDAGKPANFVDFTPTQDLVRQYFTPDSAYKGLLLYHSVGTGKTCTAIATASSTFEEKGYTILWVTRHTLKSDIWKNMFENICSLVIQDKIKNGLKLPKKVESPMKYMNDGWIKPMSYKQFSNMLLKRNIFYEEIVKRNGEDDPLKKTLIIIDEAHKLYSENVSSVEKLDTGILEKMIQNSYRLSGKDSVKVLLMTATPYTTNGMDLIKLINLLKEDDKLEDDFDKFSTKYLSPTGMFTESGSKKIQDQLSGYVSYLNRSQDARNFAHPVIKDVYSDMSATFYHYPDKNLDKAIDRVSSEISLLRKSYQTEKKAECKINVNAKYNSELEKNKTIKASDLEKCKELKPKERPPCNKSTRDRYNAVVEELKAIKKDDLKKCTDNPGDNARVKELLKQLGQLSARLEKYKQDEKFIQDKIIHFKAEKMVKMERLTLLTSKLTKLNKSFKLKKTDKLKTQIKELRGEIKKALRKVETTKRKIENLTMERKMAKIEVGRSGLGDVSQEHQLKSKCKIFPAKTPSPSPQRSPPRYQPPPPRYQPPPPRRPTSPTQTPSKNIIELKAHYKMVFEKGVSTNKPIGKNFILLNFHPDKLPQNMKEIIKNDKQALLFVSRVFHEVSQKKVLVKSELDSILNDKRQIGGKGLVKNRKPIRFTVL